MGTILEVDKVYKYFGGVKANENISLTVEQGSIVGLIGPNGSGKTTLFNSIVGTHPIDQGTIKFEDREVSKLPVPVVAKLGLLRTFQQTRIYGNAAVARLTHAEHVAHPRGDLVRSRSRRLVDDDHRRLEQLRDLPLVWWGAEWPRVRLGNRQHAALQLAGARH